jgi:hypothetical protein
MHSVKIFAAYLHVSLITSKAETQKQFHENPFSTYRVITCGTAGRHTNTLNQDERTTSYPTRKGKKKAVLPNS